MAKTRTLLGDDFDILSGDDDKTYEMMTRQDIRASGVVSVMSNIVPGPIGEMVKAISIGNMAEGQSAEERLWIHFSKLVTVNTIESYEGFEVPCKFRNPVPIKTIMKGLGIAFRTVPSASGKDDAEGGGGCQKRAERGP